MSDYIDRQAAINAVYRATGDGDKADFCADVIKSVPSADVAPVRRGYWIGGELGKCSVCGHHGCASDIWSGVWEKGQTFCPACGAILDDEEEDDADG